MWFQSKSPALSWLAAVSPRSDTPSAPRTPKPRSVKFKPLRVARPTPSNGSHLMKSVSTPPCRIKSSSSRPTSLSANAVATAVFKPKQRRSPRATLYSPPPSQTLNSRVVRTRPSPGSRRSMISPSESRSYLQEPDGLISRVAMVAKAEAPVCASVGESLWGTRAGLNQFSGSQLKPKIEGQAAARVKFVIAESAGITGMIYLVNGEDAHGEIFVEEISEGYAQGGHEVVTGIRRQRAVRKVRVAGVLKTIKRLGDQFGSDQVAQRKIQRGVEAIIHGRASRVVGLRIGEMIIDLGAHNEHQFVVDGKKALEPQGGHALAVNLVVARLIQQAG